VTLTPCSKTATSEPACFRILADVAAFGDELEVELGIAVVGRQDDARRAQADETVSLSDGKRSATPDACIQ
jgi:hypothetical protein